MRDEAHGARRVAVQRPGDEPHHPLAGAVGQEGAVGGGGGALEHNQLRDGAAERGAQEGGLHSRAVGIEHTNLVAVVCGAAWSVCTYGSGGGLSVKRQSITTPPMPRHKPMSPWHNSPYHHTGTAHSHSPDTSRCVSAAKAWK